MHQYLIYFFLFSVAVAAYTQDIEAEDYSKQREGIKDYYDPPRYIYEYQVDDEKNGVYKSHRESREGDAVSGQYSLVEADGTVRVVRYTADDKHGFQATVTRHSPSGELLP